MASNNNNNAALWSNIRKIKKKINKIFNWVDLFACEIWKCDDKNKPILNKDGKLPLSRIDKLEENLVSSDWDTSSEDSLDEEIKKQLEDIQQIKDDIKRLDARAEHYATKQQLDDLEHTHQTHTHHNPTAQQNETRIEENEERLDDIEGRLNAVETTLQTINDILAPNQNIGVNNGPGAGGGKRRKRTRGKKRTRKRRKKKTKKRRKSRRRKKKKKTKRRR